MQKATINGIVTNYEVLGSGPPLLMFSPGGFDATIDKWSLRSIYVKTRPLDHLTRHYTCILFDRRECGQSGGTVEHVTWAHYVAQAKGLLEHLSIKQAHLIGGCMGCCPVVAFGVAHPEMVLSMMLYWPVGGAKYRISVHQQFSDHLAYVGANGPQAVVALAQREGDVFNAADARGGPWASVIKADPEFAAAYAGLDINRYKLTVLGMSRSLFDRDTAPGAEPEDLMRCELPTLIIPGNDNFHATSAARYLQECLPRSQYWDAAVDQQTEAATAERLLGFLGSIAT